jgi:hypothetical protein
VGREPGRAGGGGGGAERRGGPKYENKQHYGFSGACAQLSLDRKCGLVSLEPARAHPAKQRMGAGRERGGGGEEGGCGRYE